MGLGLGLILGSVYFKTDAMPTKIMGGFSQNRYAHEFPGPLIQQMALHYCPNYYHKAIELN